MRGLIEVSAMLGAFAKATTGFSYLLDGDSLEEVKTDDNGKSDRIDGNRNNVYKPSKNMQQEMRDLFFGAKG